MASLKNTASYVKFVRGTKNAWEQLKSSGQVFNDTLYFIYENANSSLGTLYLGNKQIGGGDGQNATPVSIGELADVALSADLASGQILVFNGTSWINTTFDDIIEFNENVLELDQYGALTLFGFNNATVGQIPTVSSSGKLDWTSVGNLSEIQDIKTDISNLKANSITEVKVSEMIAAADHLQYKVVENLESIKPSEIENPDSYIYLVPTGQLSGSNLYDEYMYIENKLEQVGKWDINLTDYVTKTELTTTLGNYATKTDLTTTLGNYITTENFNNRVGSIEGRVGSLESLVDQAFEELEDLQKGVGDLSALITYDNDYTLVEQVNNLTERLTWQEIIL